MEAPAADTAPPEYGEPSPARRRPLVMSMPLGIAALFFLVAIVAQFAVGPAISPGFTYLAVVFSLGGIGALLATGLKV